MSNDPELRKRALAFITAAIASIVASKDDRVRLSRRGSCRFAIGAMFDTLQSAEQQGSLAEHCIKTLGVSVVHEKDVIHLAWEFVDKAVLAETSLNLGEIVKEFVLEVENWRARPVRYILPNGAVVLDEEIARLDIGPVSIRRTSEIAQEVDDSGDVRGRIVIGAPGSLEWGAEPSFGMTRSCWDVTLSASPGSRNETALWMIDVAISLMRFTLFNVSNQRIPFIGEQEAKSGGPPFERFCAITITGTALAGGGWKQLGIYRLNALSLDQSVMAMLAERGANIFGAKPRSVAERLQQGLGWLTRARTAKDRPERLLYLFTAIEAILTSADQSNPITQTISRYAATLLTNDMQERIIISAQLRTLYGLRSALVHTGKRAVSTADVDLLQELSEAVYFRVIDSVQLDTTHAAFISSLSNASYGLVWPINDH